MGKLTASSKSTTKSTPRQRYKNSAFLKQLGAHCRSIRLGLNYSIDRLSKESDQLSPASIDRLERGLADSQVLVLVRYAKTLGVTILDLFSFLKDESQSLNDPRIMPYKEGLMAPPGYAPVYPLKSTITHLKASEPIQNHLKPLGFVDAALKQNSYDYFAAYVRGHAMEPLIPNESLCLFKKMNGGNNKSGRIFLIEASGLHDPENGEAFTVRKWKKSENNPNGQVTIELLANNPAFPVIVLAPKSEADVHYLAQFLKVI